LCHPVAEIITESSTTQDKDFEASISEGRKPRDEGKLDVAELNLCKAWASEPTAIPIYGRRDAKNPEDVPGAL
jgi:hypothetical protein